MNVEFSEKAKKKIEEIVARYPQKEAAILPVFAYNPTRIRLYLCCARKNGSSNFRNKTYQSKRTRDFL